MSMLQLRRAAATIALVGLASVSTLPAPASAQQRPGMMMMEGTLLTVSAEGEVTAKPDIALINFGVMTKAATAEAANVENARAMTNVLAALKRVGVADRDVQTTSVQLTPDYVYNNNEAPRVTGYQAANMVQAKVRDLKNLGKAMDGLVAAGVNQMNGVTFGVDKPQPLLDQARAEAVKTARARAELYANAAGMKVVRIISIQEAGAMAPPMPMPMAAMAKMADSAATPIQQGELDLRVNVSVAFELR